MDTNANQKVTCVANYSYEALESDELSLRAGDVVREVERLPGGWWRGELRGKRGMFPDNFVTPLVDHGGRAGGIQGRCRAVFSYQPANPDELPLSVGDVLDVLGEVEEGWWQGRRQGRVGVFPSNFVVMLDAQPPSAPSPQPVPALPPKPVKEVCRVLFPYTAVNEDELTLAEGELVTIVSKDAPDRGWWRGELRGRVGLFPDNFVQLIGTAQDVEEKKPERPPSKTTSIYPVLNKYSEKTASMKELTTSKISLHKENTVNKESSIQSTITQTNKSESEKLIHSETTVTDSTVDGQVKKPPVPTKKSPTPTSGVGGLFSGLKSKMMSSDKEKEKSSPLTSTSSGSSGEWDRTDGSAASKGSTLDCVERNSILNDPRAGRVKAPRRRPPSQALRDDTPQLIALTNGHEVPTNNEKPEKPEKAEEIKPKAREWEKHRAPWMEELKLNQAKKTTPGDAKTRTSSTSDSGGGVASKAGGGSTDRLLEIGLEEKRTSHSMEMSKSTSSISNRISVMESFEESTRTRHSLESKEAAPPLPTSEPPKSTLHSPTAAGRTLTTMLDDIKKAPPSASVRTHNEQTITTNADKSPSRLDAAARVTTERHVEVKLGDKTNTIERIERAEERLERPNSAMERRTHSRGDNHEDLIAQLNSRVLNLEKLIEVQNAKWSAAFDELSGRMAAEVRQRQALQHELDKLAHCVTQIK